MVVDSIVPYWEMVWISTFYVFSLIKDGLKALIEKDIVEPELQSTQGGFIKIESWSLEFEVEVQGQGEEEDVQVTSARLKFWV